MLTEFRKYFAVRIRGKFLIALNIAPHLKCVITLLREMSGILKATIKNKITSVTTNF